MIALLTLTLAFAADGDEALVQADLGGHIKSFYVASFPYESEVFPSEPSGVGIVDGRLNLKVDVGSHLQFEAHHSLTLSPGSGGSSGVLSAGVATTAPELMPLTWEAVDEPSLLFRGRVDRLSARVSVPHLDVTVGRQAISFGSGAFFTPLDLVSPFTPAVIDQEYKPGVDAARVDVYAGMSGQITAVAAYAGDWDADGVVVAAYGQGTVGVTDLGAFAGLVRGDWVGGVSVVSALGPVGVHGDLTVSKPDDDAFVRAVLGADWRPTGTTTLSAEAYVQTLGGAVPSEYATFASGPRFATGELWLMGRTYAGLAWMQEVTPLISTNLAVIGNIEDPSAFIIPSVDWSLAGDVALQAGGYVGVGSRPDGAELRSEFGTYPVTGFLRVSAYF